MFATNEPVLKTAEPLPFSNMLATKPNDADIILPCILSPYDDENICGVFVTLIDDVEFGYKVGIAELPLSTIFNTISYKEFALLIFETLPLLIEVNIDADVTLITSFVFLTTIGNSSNPPLTISIIVL